jgi:carotenoid cleavage dioxygenase
MKIEMKKKWTSLLPEDDDHPYRTGAWKPNDTEYDASDLDVVSGEIPRDLEGIYLRNTENPLLPAIGRYHPFDGDGMVHAIDFRNGKAAYRNRFVRTEGLAAEIAAGEPQWAGIFESPAKSKREGRCARSNMKDASSTDIVVHNGVALSTFYQCGDAYQLDPRTLEDRGRATWNGKFPDKLGISAHAHTDENTGELLFFNYGTDAPYMHYGVVDAHGDVVHYTPITLPGPRLPHDMAFTEKYAILCDFPVFWDLALLEKKAYRPRFHQNIPTRFAIVPRRGGDADVRWFEASPTFVLHFINAYEEGDEIVLDGFHQGDPIPKHQPDDGEWSQMKRLLDTHAMKTRAHRWRFNLKTGQTREEFLDDRFTEFPSINQRFAGRKNRYAYCMAMEPGWFLFKSIVKYDLQTGAQDRYDYAKGIFASESPMAPRASAKEEDDGYVVTFVSDLNENASECHVFDAKRISAGPVARVRLPERISSGTHACWAPATDLRS